MLAYATKYLKKYFSFLFFIAVSAYLRFANFYETLYFTWDNGRDYFAVQKIVEGDLTLIGPTTGLQGFFLGPLWFYLGVPGYIFSDGSPYGFLLGYILMGFLAIPMYWYISKLLFKNAYTAQASAYMLAMVPGSIWGNLRVWNPLAAVPLMCGVFISLVKARTSRLYFALSFFLLGLALQTEFAYAVFYCVALFVAIPWIRQKIDWRDFAIAGGSLGMTLLPQVLFEIRYGFIMTKALLGALFGSMIIISWSKHFLQRPFQLYDATKGLLLRGDGTDLPYLFLLFAMFVGLYVIWKKVPVKKVSVASYPWQLLALMAIIPYPFYMFWKGNYGFFFEYYITSHFVFLVPLFLLGILKLYELSDFAWFKFTKYRNLLIVIVGSFVGFWYQSAYATSLHPNNTSGLRVMNEAISQVMIWAKEDHQDQSVVRVFTPNAETEHYDAILHSLAKSKGDPVPLTVKSEDTTHWYIITEPDFQLEKRFNTWYQEATAGGQLTREHSIGNLRIESWKRVDEE